MHWRNIAPFCRDDGPQTGPMIHLPATWRHSRPTKVSITESHGEARRESLKFTPESFCRTKLCACPSANAGTNGAKRRFKRMSSRQTHLISLWWTVNRTCAVLSAALDGHRRDPIVPVTSHERHAAVPDLPSTAETRMLECRDFASWRAGE